MGKRIEERIRNSPFEATPNFTDGQFNLAIQKGFIDINALTLNLRNLKILGK